MANPTLGPQTDSDGCCVTCGAIVDAGCTPTTPDTIR